LDDQETLARIHGLATRRGPGKAEPPACLCGERDFDTVFDLFNPPPGETRFPIVAGTYHRSIHRCRRCGHFLSTHDMTVLDAYSGEYVDATYGDLDGIRRDFDRISSLPPERSDNAGRVRRILDFTDARIPAAPDHPRTVLDVGSGLCIFLHGMKQAGWEGTALDPDPRAVKHARMVVGVRAVQGAFLAMSDLGHFHLVTFNKVLEHVHDPVAMLARSAGLLEPNGMIYLELPDGELALENPGVREEFFIEHHHIFSAASMALLIAQAGFELLTLERLQEPSGKLTLRAFVVPRAHQREAS
jgi:2-polyprenyl-3-methyl-5-hydroxy-6-metoxy-1,4-benzoquinol methylase